MKAYKKTIIITLIITLLPCLFGLLFWNRLPDPMPTHFNFQNEVDGYSSKPMAIFGIPLLLVFFQLVCVFATLNDPKKKQINDKMMNVIFFIIPACSMLVCALSFGTALGYSVNVSMISNLLLAFLFLMMGNYMPKVRQNYTMGIKLPWTLNNEMNWNKTHRLAGWIWMAGGILLLINIFLKSWLMMFAVILLITLIPCIYSYLLYKKENNI